MFLAGIIADNKSFVKVLHGRHKKNRPLRAHGDLWYDIFMQSVTIPKRLSQKGELVLIPRKEYEELLYIKKYKTRGTQTREKSREKDKYKDFPTVSQKEKDRHPKFYAQLDKDLEKAMADYKKGKAVGPFSSIEELQKSLLG